MPPMATSPAAVPPPDGGWGWAVVVGSFISIGFSYAFPKAITVFFKDIQIIFNASYSEIAWISSIMLAVMYAAGKSFFLPHLWSRQLLLWTHKWTEAVVNVTVNVCQRYQAAKCKTQK